MEGMMTNPQQEIKTKKCPHCFSDIPEQATYCKVCGQKVAESKATDTQEEKPVRVAPFFGVILIIAAIVLFALIVTGAFDGIEGLLAELLFGLICLIVGSVLIAKK